jgi:hypothetical protein
MYFFPFISPFWNECICSFQCLQIAIFACLRTDCDHAKARNDEAFFLSRHNYHPDIRSSDHAFLAPSNNHFASCALRSLLTCPRRHDSDAIFHRSGTVFFAYSPRPFIAGTNRWRNPEKFPQLNAMSMSAAWHVAGNVVKPSPNSRWTTASATLRSLSNT